MHTTYKHINNKSHKLIIVFTSMNPFFHALENRDKFEMEGVFNSVDLEYDLLFIKDIPAPHWYLLGIEETKEMIQAIVSKYSQVVCTGISSGGYASILFGSLFNVDLVIAINPQTYFLDLKTNTLLLPPRVEALFSDIPNIEQYYNLKPFMNETTIYYANGHHNLHNKNTNPVQQRLHHIEHFNNIKDKTNVHWLDFFVPGIKNGQLMALIKKHVT